MSVKGYKTLAAVGATLIFGVGLALPAAAAPSATPPTDSINTPANEEENGHLAISPSFFQSGDGPGDDESVTPSPDPSDSPSESASPTPTPTPSETTTPTPTPSDTPSESAAPSPSTTPSTTPSQSASPSPSATPEETANLLELAPDRFYAGDTVTLSAEGFEPGEKVTLTMVRKETGETVWTYDLGTADANGRISEGVILKSDVPFGNYYLYATGADSGFVAEGEMWWGRPDADDDDDKGSDDKGSDDGESTAPVADDSSENVADPVNDATNPSQELANTGGYGIAGVIAGGAALAGGAAMLRRRR